MHPNDIVYHASIDPLFLSKVDRVFDASPKTVFNELLQNARRAGAKNVTVKLSHEGGAVHVEFSDDGEGLSSPAPLLRLASSEWNETTQSTEDPAGMGFFCLSNLERVRVWSREWYAEFTPAVFTGRESLRCEYVQPAEQYNGLRITWSWPGQTPHTVDDALSEAGKYCELESITRVNRDHTRVITPVGFLHKCEQEILELPELGVRIGVTPGKDYSGHTGHHLNFHGVVVKLTDVGEHLEALSSVMCDVRVDVIRAGDIQLVLPARNAIKHNAARSALLVECERALYMQLSRRRVRGEAGHTLPFKVYRRAMDVFGIDIGESVFRLRAMFDTPYRAKYTQVLTDLDEDTTKRILRTFNERVDYTDGFVCYNQDCAMEGYSWYDNLPRITALSVNIDGAEMNVEDITLNQRLVHKESEEVHSIVNSIFLTITIGEETFSEYVPVLTAGYDDYTDFDGVGAETRVYVTREALSSTEGRAAVRDYLHTFLFDETGAYDDDTSQSEKSEAFSRDIHKWLLELTGNNRAAMEYELGEMLSDISYSLRDGSMCWTATYDGRKGHDVVLANVQKKEDEVNNHKMLTVHAHGEADTALYAVEFTSSSPITEERIKDFLKDRHGPAYVDLEFKLTPVDPVLDLDLWESRTP